MRRVRTQTAIRQFSNLLITIQIVTCDCIGLAGGLLRNRTALAAENLFLRKQIDVELPTWARNWKTGAMKSDQSRYCGYRFPSEIILLCGLGL